MFTKEIKGIIKFVLTAAVTAFAIAGIFFTFTIESKMNKAREDGFNDGYHAAIEDAELVSITEDQFTLTFNSEEHIYHSTIGGETMEKAFENGYHAAIEEAVLVESSDEGYSISFNGEVSWYTFD